MAFDVALVLGLTLLALILGYLFPAPPTREDPLWSVVRTCLEFALVIGLLVRRRFPVTFMSVLAVVTVIQALLLDLGMGQMLSANIPTNPWLPGLIPFAVYAVMVYADEYRRKSVGWALIGLVTVLAVRPWSTPSVQVVVNGLVCTISPAILGLYIAARRRLLDEWRERAERAEREQYLLAEQARSDERARLASDMHDVVTHRLSLMVLQAGALAVTAQDHATRRAAEELRAAGCQALEELRDLVGVLRSAPRDGGGGRPERPPASAPDLSTLVAGSRAAGLDVTLTEAGSPAALAPTVGRTAYRVVQEALTNVTKHAMGSEVDVRVRYDENQVQLIIRNTAPPEPITPDLASSGSGTGLHGLRQRVELVGGSLHAGVTTDGGFEVNAILPAFVPTGV